MRLLPSTLHAHRLACIASDLDRCLAARKEKRPAKSDAARRGWETRRAS